MMRYGGDPSMDMGLETDRAAQESIQSSLEDRGDDNNQTQSQSYNFNNIPKTIGRGIESLMQNIKMAPDTTGIQSFVNNKSL